jgi:hypothetical protein
MNRKPLSEYLYNLADFIAQISLIGRILNLSCGR